MPSSDPKGITRLEGDDQRGQPMRGDGDNQGRRGMIDGANSCIKVQAPKEGQEATSGANSCAKAQV